MLSLQTRSVFRSQTSSRTGAMSSMCCECRTSRQVGWVNALERLRQKDRHKPAEAAQLHVAVTHAVATSVSTEVGLQ